MVGTRKKGMAVLSMLLALVLTIILLFAFLKAGTQLWRPDVDNLELLETFVEQVNYLSAINEPSFEIPEDLDSFSKMVYSSSQGFVSSVVPFTINENELFLFFSGGDESIRLRFNPTQTFMLSPDIASELIDEIYFYEFLRPDVEQCQNRACVCYYDDGPFWTTIKEKPYVSPQKIIVGRSYDFDEPICYAFEEADIVFGNRRGRADTTEAAKKDLYVDKINELRKSSDKADEGFIAQSMDVVTLIQPALFDYFSSGHASKLLKEDKDFLFKLKDKRNAYHYEDQDKDIVQFLASGMRWEGGVVVGGMGYAKNSAQARKRVLEGPPINLIFQKSLAAKEDSTKELLAPLVIGVGFPVNPLNKETVDDLQTKQELLEYISLKKKSFTKTKNLVEKFILPEFSPGQEINSKHPILFNELLLSFESVLDDQRPDTTTEYAFKRKECLSASAVSSSFSFSQLEFIQKDSYVLLNMSLCTLLKPLGIEKQLVKDCFFSQTIDLPFTKIKKEVQNQNSENTFEEVSSLTFTSSWYDDSANKIYFRYIQKENNYKEELKNYELPFRRDGDSFILSFMLSETG